MHKTKQLLEPVMIYLIYKFTLIVIKGPTVEMVEDFWDMVLQENASVIVMLTNLVENGVVSFFYKISLDTFDLERQ